MRILVVSIPTPSLFFYPLPLLSIKLNPPLPIATSQDTTSILKLDHVFNAILNALPSESSKKILTPNNSKTVRDNGPKEAQIPLQNFISTL